MKKKAIVLLSGGLDSITVLALAKKQGYACYALSFDYGQRHNAELIAAAQIAADYQVEDHKIIKLGVEGEHFTIHTPLIALSKAEIIKQGVALGVDYQRTVSCYSADEQGRACRVCDACRLRETGFIEAGIKDPTRYQKS